MKYETITAKLMSGSEQYSFIAGEEFKDTAHGGKFQTCRIELNMKRPGGQQPLIVHAIKLFSGSGLEVIPVSSFAATGKRCSGLTDIFNSCRAAPEKWGEVIGAVNGGFFVFMERLASRRKRFFSEATRVGDSLGFLATQGKIIAPPLYGRAAIVFNETGSIKIVRPLMTDITIQFGRVGNNFIEITPGAVNDDKPDCVCAFTPAWPQAFSPPLRNSVAITIVNETAVKISGQAGAIVPINGAVIRISHENLGPATIEELAKIKDISYALSPAGIARFGSVWHALEAGPRLVANSKSPEITPEYIRQQGFLPSTPPAPAMNSVANHYHILAPRAAVGIKRNGNIVFAIFEGRIPGVSEGATIQEVSYIMRDLECSEAMNLDGGASAEAIIDGRPLNVPQLGGGQSNLKRLLKLLRPFYTPGTLPGPDDLGADSERTIGNAFLITIA